MNRLTRRDCSFFDCPEEQNFDAFDISDFMNDVYERLKMYENFMENNHFKSLNAINRKILNLEKENQSLKDKYEQLDLFSGYYTSDLKDENLELEKELKVKNNEIKHLRKFIKLVNRINTIN